MIYAFLLGILVTLTPSLIALALLVWRADAPAAQENVLEFAPSYKSKGRFHGTVDDVS